MAKSRKIILQLSLMWLLTGCSDNNAAQPGHESNTSPATSNAGSNDGLVGEWEQMLTAADKNGNEILEEDERKAGSATLMDYMKLNSDSSAVILYARAPGRWETYVNASSGKTYLNLYSQDNTKYRKGAIISVGKNELLILNKFGGNSFTVWKRL